MMKATLIHQYVIYYLDMNTKQNLDELLYKAFHEDMTEEEFEAAIDSIPGADDMLSKYVSTLVPAPSSSLPVRLAIKQSKK